MKIMKLNEWKCGIDINDADIYVEPTGALKDIIDCFKLIYNPRTGRYDCDGNVNLRAYYNHLSYDERMEFDNAFVSNGKMTIMFGNVKGDFYLPGVDNKPYILTSLEGCPEKVGGKFLCNNNQLTSLEGCPETVGGKFLCDNNQLTSLEGCPKSVGGSFCCTYNQLTSLKGCPETIGGYFDCEGNQLTSLEGCPKTVGGDFNCRYNQLTSLEGCPESVGGSFFCNGNNVVLAKEYVRSVCDVKNGIFV